MGSNPWSGTSHILKISWADGSCFALTPSKGLWSSTTVNLTADCDQSPSRIRIETHQGSGDKSNIFSVVVDEPFEVVDEGGEDGMEDVNDAGKTTQQRDTLCIADFESSWLVDVLERHCVYEHVMGVGKK